MYKGPIELFNVEEYSKQIDEQIEKAVYEVVMNVGINVNREELIKALEYDRNQYEKGYRDGSLDGVKWHPYPKEKPTDWKEYIVTLKYTKCTTSANYDPEDDEWRGNDDFWIPNNCIVAWLELPEPYEEEECFEYRKNDVVATEEVFNFLKDDDPVIITEITEGEE